MTGLIDEMKEKTRQEKSPGDREVLQYTVIDIVKGKLGNKDRQFEPAAELIYRIGEGNNRNNHIGGIKERFRCADGHVSFSDDSTLSKLHTEGIVDYKETEDGRKVSSLTALGDKLYNRIRPLFQGLYEREELEEVIEKLENRYTRRPKLTELETEIGRRITEDDIPPSVKWEAPEGSADPFNIIAGFVLKNTSAEGVDRASEDNNLLSIAFSEVYDEGDKELRDYTESDTKFLESLELKHHANNTFSLKLDKTSDLVFNNRSIGFKVLQNDKIKEELIELAR